jgi:hypothetical protein
MALITFLPLGYFVLSDTGNHKYMAWVFVLQNIAANLGGMLTPFGNPQNLYLYTKFNIPTLEFMGIMVFPFLLAVLMLTLSVLFFPKIKMTLSVSEDIIEFKPKRTAIYLVLFTVSILAVFSVIHYLIAAAPFLAHRMGSRKCRSLYALAYKERRVHLNTGPIPHARINERLQEHGTTLNKQAVQLSGMKESEYLRNYITRKIEHNLFYIFTKSTIITACSKKDGWMRTVKQPQRCRQRVITVYDKTQRRTSCPMAYIKRRIIKQCGTRTDQNGVVHGTQLMHCHARHAT